jgi:7-cyano-7-deazaguanine synthase
MIPKRIIHLLSGGLDSVTMLQYLCDIGHSVHCLLADYGQPHVKELEFARRSVSRLSLLKTEVKLPGLGGLTKASWIVPNRNAILLSVAANIAVQAQADTVTIGCNADDAAQFPDCRPEFLDSYNDTLRQAGIQVEVCAPFLHYSKAKIGGMARDLGITRKDVWTCYLGGVEPCGDCPACVKLKVAL